MDIDWQFIQPRPSSGSFGGDACLDAAISSSTELAEFFAAAASARQSILIVVNDPYRSTQTRPALIALSRCLWTLVALPRFNILVATGTHVVAPVLRKEFEARTFADCGLFIDSVTWHDSLDAAAMTQVGGVRLNRLVVESPFVLAIGSVEPHYFAGVTGPHKTLTIGCMAHADIEANHAHALSVDSRILKTRGNPVFDSVAQALTSLAGPGKQIFAIGEVIRDDTIAAAAVGEALSVVDELLPAMRQCFVYDVARPADLLHLRVPPPLGKNLYQADKALKNHASAVRDGGGILLEAACEEGVGPRRFIELLRAADTYANACELIARDGYRLGDHKAVKLRHLTDPACRSVHVVVASAALRSDELTGTGLHIVPDVPQGLDWLSSRMALPPKRGLVIEDAGNLCPGF